MSGAVGSSPNIALIVKDMILDANLKTSKELACAVQFRGKDLARDRGVHQALFYILLGADMPSILIEAGFMSNTKDRKRILDSKLRHEFAEKLADGIHDFRLRKKDSKIQKRLSQCQVKELN